MDNENTTEHPVHQCDECGRTFNNRGAMLSHQRSHSNVRFVAPEPGPTPRFDHVPEGEILGQNNLYETKIATGAAPSLPTGQVFTVTTPVIPTVRLVKLFGDLPDITKATPGSAAYDLHAAIENRICIGVGDRELIGTGLQIELPVGYVAKVVPRSGLALKNGISLLNSPGIIDSDYRGEICAIMINHSSTKFWVEPGMRIAQMLIEPVASVAIQYVDKLSDTSRGSGGFGSTGTK